MVGIVGVGWGFLVRKRKRFVVSCLSGLSSSPQPIAMVEKTTRELRKERGEKNEMKKKRTALVLDAGGALLVCQSWVPRKCVLLSTRQTQASSRVCPFDVLVGGMGAVASHGRKLVGLTFRRGHRAQRVPRQWDDIKRVA